MKYLTYLIYIVLWEGLIIGGTGYAVFWLGHNGWWLLAAFIVACCAYKPQVWIHAERNE